MIRVRAYGMLIARFGFMRAAALLVYTCIVVGCERQPARVNPGASAPAAPTTSAAVASVPSTAPSATAALTDNPPAKQQQPLSALVHLPSRLGPGQKAPLLVMLHSLGTSDQDIQRTHWPSLAERNGVAWMAPNGPVDALGRRFWDAGPSCCNFTGAPVDHVAALRALLHETLDRNPIDRERVFVGGMSNGGFMAHRLACAAPDLVRGVVSISGAGPLEQAGCKEPVSLRVLVVHGDADPIVSYAGGHLFQDPKLPEHASAEKTATDWALRLGCRSAPRSGGVLNLESRYPGNETRVTRYEACTRGALELWTVTGGNHYLAFFDPAPQSIWDFLNRR